jgi:hypothetical protein
MTTDEEIRDKSYRIEKCCQNCRHCYLTLASTWCNIDDIVKEVEVCGTCDVWEGK